MCAKTKTAKDGSHEQYVRVGIPQSVFELLQKQKEEHGNTTLQEFLAPVLRAVALGEISRSYAWSPKPSGVS